MPAPESKGERRAGMRSIGVSHNGKDLHADLVVQSWELLKRMLSIAC